MKVILIFLFYFTDYPGCRIDASTSAVCRFKSAYIASFLYPTLYKREDYNVWEIRGYYGQHIELEILDLEMKNELKINSFLEVFDVSLQGKQTSIGRFTTLLIPFDKVISSWHMMDIEFRVGNPLPGRGFLANHRIVDNNAKDYLNTTGKYESMTPRTYHFVIGLMAFILYFA